LILFLIRFRKSKNINKDAKVDKVELKSNYGNASDLRTSQYANSNDVTNDYANSSDISYSNTNKVNPGQYADASDLRISQYANSNEVTANDYANSSDATKN